MPPSNVAWAKSTRFRATPPSRSSPRARTRPPSMMVCSSALPCPRSLTAPLPMKYPHTAPAFLPDCRWADMQAPVMPTVSSLTSSSAPAPRRSPSRRPTRPPPSRCGQHPADSADRPDSPDSPDRRPPPRPDPESDTHRLAGQGACARRSRRKGLGRVDPGCGR